MDTASLIGASFFFCMESAKAKAIFISRRNNDTIDV